VLDVDEVVLFQDIFIGKPPGTAAVQWHQDYSYWPLDSWDGLTMWLALDHTDVDNGCLRYIPGTHQLGEKRPADFFVGTAQPVHNNLPPLLAEERAAQAVDAPVTAGSILVHHPLVWHMSPVNRSSRPRHAWSLTWLLPTVCWRPEHAPHPFGHQLQPVAGQPVRGRLFPRFARRSD
jgi:ectoine hydroxylase-related dioxygenase (phytanoyl-CoA dioxygenase family)